MENNFQTHFQIAFSEKQNSDLMKKSDVQTLGFLHKKSKIKNKLHSKAAESLYLDTC